METKDYHEQDSFVRRMVETGAELEDRQIKDLMDGNSEKDWELIIEYIKRNPTQRLEQVLLCRNFDLVKPENFDRYMQIRQTIQELLSEKDGVIDTNKREQAQLLIQSIPRLKTRG
ncbi:hypothetical protein EPN83_02790 [Patescibacteria group bacterium]|nr:MAG: hypothetical protein EPN83_02790 [Patescibacteria group bacterium]